MISEAQRRANDRWAEKNRGTCADCGKPTSRKKYPRCKSCSHIGAVLSDEHKAAIIQGHAGLRGENNPNWKGGRRLTNKGYVWVYSPDHPNNRRRYVLEHRLVVEKEIGRYLKKQEVVHHIDGNKENNSLDNLMLFFNDTAHRRYERKLEMDSNHILWDGSICRN